MYKIKLLIVVIILCLYSCKNKAQNFVEIEQVNSNYPIFLKYNEENKESKLLQISFPLVFNIKNKALKHIEILPTYSYNYGTNYGMSFYNWWGGCCGFIPIQGKLKSFDECSLSYLENKVCVFTTIHFYRKSDTNHLISSFIKPYMEKMTTLDKDTLHIASIQELKKTNPELLNTFLKGDSIELTFYYDELYHGIKLPVEIK